MRPATAAIVAGVAAMTSLAHAEPARTLGVSAELVLPLEPWRDATGPAGGGSVWVGVPLGDADGGMAITARLGAWVHATRDIGGESGTAIARLTEVPLLGGVRYALRGGAVPVWLRGEVGLVFTRLDVQVGGRRESDSAIVFGSRLAAGVGWSRFGLEASAWLADLADLDHQIGVAISASAEVWKF